MHANIDVHSRKMIAKFPKDGIKCIEKLQSHCEKMAFADKSRYDRTFKKSHIKEGNPKLITLKYSKIHMLYQFQ